MPNVIHRRLFFGSVSIMGTEVAARPSLPTGLTVPRPAAGASGGRRKHERERSFSSSGSVGSNASSSRPIYARDYGLRIQRKKYSLAKAIVCVGAKIHHRTSPALSLPEEKIRHQNVFRENSKISSSNTAANAVRLRDYSFISESNSQHSYATNQKSSSKYSDSQDYKNRFWPIIQEPGPITEPNIIDNSPSSQELRLPLRRENQHLEPLPHDLPLSLPGFDDDDVDYTEESYYFDLGIYR